MPGLGGGPVQQGAQQGLDRHRDAEEDRAVVDAALRGGLEALGAGPGGVDRVAADQEVAGFVGVTPEGSSGAPSKRTGSAVPSLRRRNATVLGVPRSMPSSTAFPSLPSDARKSSRRKEVKQSAVPCQA
jgi:hypothetical protein